jgi:hypothetical protein
MFELPETAVGQGLNLKIYRQGCPQAVYSQKMVSIPEPAANETPVCQSDLGQTRCETSGGTFNQVTDSFSICLCP